MTIKTKAFAKGGIATFAVGAMALASATPAFADDHRDRDGISVGDVIAGAVIIGGIAAIAGAFDNDRDDRYRDDRYYNNGRYNNGQYNNGRYNNGNRWGYRGNPRQAVEQCVNAARSEARRYGYRTAQVTDIRDVDDTNYGWKVKGRIRVDNRYAGGRYSRYGYYDRNNRYNNWNDRDSGSFTCRIDRGRVIDVDFDGIRGLR